MTPACSLNIDEPVTNWLTKYSGKLAGSFDAQLLIDVHATKHHLNVSWGYTEVWCQKSQHMISRFSSHWSRSYADLELVTLGFANGITSRAGFPQNVDYKRVTIPCEEIIASDVAGLHD
jgi:hypothetical protein